MPITDLKVNSIAKTGADFVTTSCPACLNRIEGSLNLAGCKPKALHIVDLLAMAYEEEERLAKAT